jgi:methylmalonyl-CoA/ethylmalonyl-CoA epimerase
LLGEINGINIAVRDLARAVQTYETVFGVESVRLAPDSFAVPGLVGARLQINGFQINLITSTAADTSISRFLSRHGEGVFLLSIRVANADNAAQNLIANGVKPLFVPPLRGDFGAVTFVHPKNLHGVQLEVLECPSGSAHDASAESSAEGS